MHLSEIDCRKLGSTLMNIKKMTLRNTTEVLVTSKFCVAEGIFSTIDFCAYAYKIYSIYQPILRNLPINLLLCKLHKQHNQTVLRDSILRLHTVDYFLKYFVKFNNFYLKLTEFVVQICVPNYEEIRRLEKNYGKSLRRF